MTFKYVVHRRPLVVVGDRGAYLTEGPEGLFGYATTFPGGADALFLSMDEAEAAARIALADPACPMWIDASNVPLTEQK